MASPGAKLSLESCEALCEPQLFSASLSADRVSHDPFTQHRLIPAAVFLQGRKESIFTGRFMEEVEHFFLPLYKMELAVRNFVPSLA